jgi:predicted ATPase
MADSRHSSARIRTPDQRLRVFVSSTLEELAAERSMARSAIQQLRLTPVMFDLGARPHPAQAVYRAYLEQSDVFLGIYWQRYGWVGPGMDVSGLEAEFRLASQLPQLLYVKVPAPGIEPGLSRMLDEIRAEGSSAYKTFTDPEELRELILNDLATMLTERFEPARRAGRGQIAPAPVTPLVGRDHDIDELASLLTTENRRLLVLTGAGGIGKTRLALAVMERTRRDWRDGTAFVDLSPVTDPRLVPEAILSALSLVGQGRERPLDTLQRRLAERHMLLLLDNFEQVSDAAPVVAELLRGAAQLHVLVTSRVVLRVRGEQDWRVAPLSVPPGSTSPAALTEASAVRLFVERVREVQPVFDVTSGNASAVAELCRRLDGLPLALELAAAWLRLLTPEQMLQRLYERLGSAGVLVDLPDRQQTLTRTIQWSYDLLPGTAQQLLARLSVFASPFTVQGAEMVCGGDADMIAGLSTLLDQSMIRPAERPDGERAFRLLDPIRHFAAAQLDSDEEILSNLERYLLQVLGAARSQHGSHDQDRRQLDSEQPNLLVVLRWIARSRRSPGPLLRAIADVWIWLYVRGHLRRTSELWQLIESMPEDRLSSEEERIARSWLVASGLLNDGRLTEAGALLDEILPTARRGDDPSLASRLLLARAIARPYRADNPPYADFEEALKLARNADDPLVLGYTLSHYGSLLRMGGDATRARVLHEQMLDIARSLDDRNMRAEALYDLAGDAMSAGDLTSAEARLATAADHYRSIGSLSGMARCLGALSALAVKRERGQLAARLIGAAEAARDSIGLAPWPWVREAEQRTIQQIQALLSGTEFTAQISAGRNQKAEDALADALLVLHGQPRQRQSTQTGR